MVTKGPDGYLGNLTGMQAKALQDLKMEALKRSRETWKYDISQFDDFDYLRFLRARKFDLVKTLEMFDKYIHWRIDFGVDNIFVRFTFATALGLQVPGEAERQDCISARLPQD